MNGTIKYDHSLESYFQVYSVCKFGKFASFGHGAVRSERFNMYVQKVVSELQLIVH